MKCECANVGRRSRRRKERTNERTNRRKKRRNSDRESGLDERNRERATGRWRALSKLERPGSFLLRARFHSRGNIGAPLFPFLFSTSPFSFRRFSFFSFSFFSLPFIFFFFLFPFFPPTDISLCLCFSLFQIAKPLWPRPRSFRRGCNVATLRGEISSPRSRDTRVTYRRGPSPGIATPSSLLTDDTRVPLHR